MHERPPRPDPERRCVELALSQNGVIEHGQALDLGLSDDAIYRRARSGRWTRLLTRLYCLAGTPPSWLGDLTAASLWAGQRGLVSGRAAAALWELDGCPEGPIELLVTGHPKSPDARIVLRYAITVAPADGTIHRGLRVTTPSRTLLELGHLLTAEGLELAAEDAFRRGLTSAARLRWMLEREWQGLPGAPALRALLDARASRPTDSALEVKLFALLRGAKIKLPQRQVEIREGDRFLGRVDFVYPDERLVIEAHSFRFHSGRGPWDHDVQRDKAFRRAGWRVLYVTYEDISKRPGQVVSDIRAGLGNQQLFS